MKKSIEISRNLRKNQTEAEKIVWDNIRNRKVSGLKFLRQYPIEFILDGVKRFFIADFYCAEKKLVIEIDGEIHDYQKEYDLLRDDIISNLGIKVIRFTNQEVKENMNNVIEKILLEVTKIPLSIAIERG